MASVSSTSSANEYGLQQLRLRMAQRNADQAGQAAQALRIEAQSAQRVADNAQENARSLAVQSDQAQQKAGQAQQGLAMLRSTPQFVARVANAVDQTVSRQPTPAPATPPTKSASPAPVVNSQGQVTGKTINTTA